MVGADQKFEANLRSRVSNYKLEPFFELSHDALIIAGYDGYFKRVNPAFKKLLGYPDKELFSRPINYFVYSEDQDKTDSKRNLLRQNQPLLNFENRYLTATGDLIWLSWTSIPVVDENLIYAIAKNITHRKKLEEERDSLLSEITKDNQKLKLLNYSTSHDLRTPVGNLKTIFNLLDTSHIHDPETLEILGMMKDSTENLHHALNSYLDALSKGSLAEIPVAELKLQPVYERVYHSIQSLITSSNALFIVDFSAFDSLRVNPGYLESIFLNLITNSIRYARPGHRATIYISTRLKDGVRQLIFSDNGIGMDLPKVKDRIFGLHETFSNHTESKGIGLYLIHSYMVSLGGNIEVESEPGQGTSFILSFRD